jgi:predicted lysophospholipase L1 biosynthesis ABC-type transport system permease subunit
MGNRRASAFNWVFWAQWVLAGTLGWVLSGVVGAMFPDVIIGQLLVGGILGALQWFVLRHRLSTPWWWIAFSTLGWALGWSDTLAFFPPEIGVFAGLILGAITGAAQWLVLRRVYRQAGWWIPASAAAWMLGLTGVLGYLLVGTIVGAASGLALELLERYAVKTN